MARDHHFDGRRRPDQPQRAIRRGRPRRRARALRRTRSAGLPRAAGVRRVRRPHEFGCAAGLLGPARTRPRRARCGSRPSSAAPGPARNRRSAPSPRPAGRPARRATRSAWTGVTPRRPAASRAAGCSSSSAVACGSTLVTGPRIWNCLFSRYHGKVADAYGVCSQLVALGRVVVREEDDAVFVDAFAQHRPADRSAVSHGGQHHRVGFGDAPALGLANPGAQQGKPTIVEPINIEIVAAVPLPGSVLLTHRRQVLVVWSHHRANATRG